MNDPRFYGYVHWTLEAVPRCFYVGKGRRCRPHNQSLRGKKWKAVVARLGLQVEICAGPISEQEAIAWEINAIEKMQTFTTSRSTLNGSDIRCNFTKGGDGVSGYKHTLEARKRMSLTRKGILKPVGFADKVRRLKSKSVQQLDKQGNVIAEFESATQAHNITGASCAQISLHCQGKRRNQLWRFKLDA